MISPDCPVLLYVSVRPGIVLFWCDGLLQESESTEREQELRQSPEKIGEW